MSYTKGKITANYSDIIDSNLHPVFRVSDRESKKEKHANARRLVACWNEHDDLVHDNAQLYQSLQGEMRGRLEAEKERDELVKALRHFSTDAVVRDVCGADVVVTTCESLEAAKTILARHEAK